MDDITRVERIIFSCPETNGADYERYPMIDKERFTAMEEEYAEDNSKIYVYGYVRRKSSEPFIDLYVWDCLLYPQCYMRFVVQEGFRFSEEDLELFSSYMKDNRLFIPMKNEVELYFDLFEAFPQWPLKLRFKRSIGEELERIYYMSHRSGPREILYKAELNKVADNIDRIPGHNIVGTTPVSIIGHNMPLKLLRILNQSKCIHKLYSEESINECVAVYKMYASHIGRELPSHIQWEYLTELYRHGGLWGGIAFNRSIYRQLKYEEDRKCFFLYERFFKLREALLDIYKVDIPTLYELKSVVVCMEKILSFKKDEIILNAKIRSRKQREKRYEFSNDKYIIVLPIDCMDFCKEAMQQRNCLMNNYLEGHADSMTTILFVRRKIEPSKPYVTMEISADREIKQLYGKFNHLPHRGVYEFIEEYSLRKGFVYDPERLINDAVDELMQIGEDIWEYVEDYYQRNNRYLLKEDDDILDKMIQLTLKDCYPEIFAIEY